MLPSSHFHIISVTIFGQFIFKIMRKRKPKDENEYQRVINDYAFLHIFAENDFLKDEGYIFAHINKYDVTIPEGRFIVEDGTGTVLINNELLQKLPRKNILM